MRMRFPLWLAVLAVLACSAPATTADNPVVHPGLFFTIVNGCSSAVRGFAVGDELCLLKVELATYTRAIFQGDMIAGEEKFAMACMGEDGKGLVIFVPPINGPGQAVKVEVEPNQKVKIPESFCGPALPGPETQLKKE